MSRPSRSPGRASCQNAATQGDCGGVETERAGRAPGTFIHVSEDPQ